MLFGYRLQLFALASQTTVSHACRVFGVSRDTYHRWKRRPEHEQRQRQTGQRLAAGDVEREQRAGGRRGAAEPA